MSGSPHFRYVMKSPVHAAQVLNAFQPDGEVPRRLGITARTGMCKAICFRLLYTLHMCGFVEKVEANR